MKKELKDAYAEFIKILLDCMNKIEDSKLRKLDEIRAKKGTPAQYYCRSTLDEVPSSVILYHLSDAIRGMNAIVRWEEKNEL